MRIHVLGLPYNQDFSTEFEVPTDTFIPDKTKHAESEVLFLGNVKCHATLRKMSGDEVLLQLKAITWIEAECDRCTETYRVPVAVETSLLCKPTTRKAKEQEDEDEGLVFYTNQEINFDEIVREQILLNLPIQKICDENCQGLCQACGENLNQGDHFCARQPYFEHKAKVL